MADGYNFESTVDAALNFQNNKNLKAGHMRNMTMSGKPLKEDFSLRDPENPANYLDAAAIIVRQKWNKQPGGVLMIQGVVTGANQGLVQHSIEDAKDAKAEGSFFPILFKPHQGKKLNFKNWNSPKALECKILKNDEYNSSIDDERDPNYDQLEIYNFTLFLLAKEEAGLQTIDIDYDTEIKLSLAFGQKK